MSKKLTTAEMGRMNIDQYKESDKLPLVVVLDNVRSQHKKDALKFIKFCARPDMQLKYAGMIEAFPAFESAFEQFIFSSSQRLQTYTGILSTARTLPNSTVMGTIMEILKLILAVCATQIVENRFTQASLDRELDLAAKEIEYLLSIYEG